MSPPSSASHPRRRRPPAPRTSASASVEEVFAETPPIISSEEKHQLILAHSAARAPRDPLQRATLWGGVAIAFGAILVGWFVTVGHDVKSQLAGVENEAGALTERLNAFTSIVDENGFNGARTGIPNPTATAAAEELVGVMKDLFGSTSTPEGRTDLFAPAPNTDTATGSQKEESAPTMFYPEKTPGLAPAE